MDRGFAGFIEISPTKYFVLRIKNNCQLEFEGESGLVKIGSSRQAFAI